MATGLETWFMLYNLKTALPPARWKMAIVIFVGAHTTSILSRSLLGFLMSDSPLITSTLIFSTILVISVSEVIINMNGQISK